MRTAIARFALPVALLALLSTANTLCAQGPAEARQSRGRQLAQSLLENLGKDQESRATEAASAALNGVGGVDLSNLSGLDRAQSFLDQHLPGRFDLSRPDLGLGEAAANPAPENPNRDQLQRSAANEAARAFRNGEYARALRWLVAVTGDLPRDGELRQFESLAWLAAGQVDKSESAIIVALQHSDPWHRDRMSQFFAQPEIHQALLDQVSSAAKSRSDQAGFWVLVAYHEHVLGNASECSQALERAAELDVDHQIPGVVLDKLRMHADEPKSVLD